MTTIPGHYTVVSAISGDGTPEDTQAYVLYPAASESWVPFGQLEQLYETDPASIMMQY